MFPPSSVTSKSSQKRIQGSGFRSLGVRFKKLAQVSRGCRIRCLTLNGLPLPLDTLTSQNPKSSNAPIPSNAHLGLVREGQVPYKGRGIVECHAHGCALLCQGRLRVHLSKLQLKLPTGCWLSPVDFM